MGEISKDIQVLFDRNEASLISDVVVAFTLSGMAQELLTFSAGVARWDDYSL